MAVSDWLTGLDWTPFIVIMLVPAYICAVMALLVADMMLVCIPFWLIGLCARPFVKPEKGRFDDDILAYKLKAAMKKPFDVTAELDQLAQNAEKSIINQIFDGTYPRIKDANGN